MALASSTACSNAVDTTAAGPAVLLTENFDQEGSGQSVLNYTSFARWIVTRGSVDLVGTAPYNLLPAGQGLYVDLDGTSKEAGTLETRSTLELPAGTYELTFKLAGTPRPNQAANTVVVSLAGVFQETITLDSYAPLQSYTRTIAVTRETDGKLRFAHQGGDDYGVLVDDIQLRRL